MTSEQGSQLAEALMSVLVSVGMIRKDAAMTGPELLLAAETFCASHTEPRTPALALSKACDVYWSNRTPRNRLKVQEAQRALLTAMVEAA